MIGAAATGASLATSSASALMTGSGIMYKFLRFLYRWGNYDFLDPGAFPVNETGVRLWTLVIFGCLMQNAINDSSDSNLKADSLTGSMFAMMVIFTGIIIHCSYKILSHWSGASWNWGVLWVYIVLLITQFVYTYITNNDTVGNFSLRTNMSTLTGSQTALLYTTFAVVGLWILANLVALAMKRKINAKRYSAIAMTKRLIWLVGVIAILALHVTKDVNGPGQHWHFHHALVGWAAFCIAVLLGTIPGWVGRVNHFIAVIGLGVVIHGSVTWGIRDYEFLTHSEGSGPSASARNIHVCMFIAAILLLSIRMPQKKQKARMQAKVAPLPKEAEKTSLLRL